MKQEIKPATGRLGVLVVGVGGNVILLIAVNKVVAKMNDGKGL